MFLVHFELHFNILSTEQMYYLAHGNIQQMVTAAGFETPHKE